MIGTAAGADREMSCCIPVPDEKEGTGVRQPDEPAGMIRYLILISDRCIDKKQAANA